MKVKVIYKPHARNLNKETSVKEFSGEVLKEYKGSLLIQNDLGMIRTVYKNEIIEKMEIK